VVVVIIGVAGKARSGKDTFADYLENLLMGYDFLKTGFAVELKRQVMRDFNLSYEQLYGNLKEEPDDRYRKVINTRPFCTGLGKGELPDYRWTPREIMQKYGEFMRSVDRDYWIKALFRSAEERNYPNILITDVRYKNEADACKERGGYLIQVIRENRDMIANSEHISETDLDNYKDFDFIVENNSSLDDLKENAVKLGNIFKKELDSFKLMEVENG
jgi:hypothetical protein